MRSQGGLAEPLPDVFLIIDNWPAMRANHEDLEPTLTDIAARGLGYGLHLILTANRWVDIRKALVDSIAGRLELRLQEPAESVIDRKAAANVASRIPGRGLTQGPLHIQVALPRMDGKTQTADLPRAVMDLAGRVEGAWTGPRAERIRVLPTVLPVAELPEAGSAAGPGVPLGLAEADLQPVYVDLAARDRNFLILGDGESGKTTALKTLLAGLQKRSDPAAVQISVLDYRRKLLRSVGDEFRLSYAFSAAMATDQMAELAQTLRRRLPHSGLTMAQLQAGRWWSGPDVYLVVDDYDLVSTSAGNPLLPVAELLPQARDIGLHVIMTRRVRGLTRAFEPFINAMRDLGPTGLLLSGDPQEGAVLGQYRASAQIPGRALLVRRGEPGAVMQVALSEE
jgi:DNA segregation ATPase FtsK/SpoIIIE, S-DNA-T family